VNDRGRYDWAEHACSRPRVAGSELVLRSSQMIQLIRVRAARAAVSSRSAMKHLFASEPLR